MKIKTVLSIGFLLLSNLVFSQNQEPMVVTGKVTSKTETEGLPGVNVIIKGTVTGMITDINGM
jgi:hypothetical protein